MSKIFKVVDGWKFGLTSDTEQAAKEALVSCTDLAERLGYERAATLRDLASSPAHKEKLNRFGVVRLSRTTQLIGATTRVVEEPLFNRKQALYLIAKSGTPTANDLTVQFIEAFDALLEQYTSKPMTKIQMLLAQAQAMAELEEKQAAQDADIAMLKAAEARRSELEAASGPALLALPPASVDAPSKTQRALLNEAVRLYAVRNGGGEAFREAWRKLYRELYSRCHVDIRKVAKNRGVDALDIVEEKGLLEQMYAIALEVFI